MMNRASAIAALLALGATAAHAEVTLYGKVDAGFVHETGGKEGTVDKLSTGVMLPSRLGVKAAFDIGNGMKAKGQLETGVCADSNNNPGAPYCTGGGFMGRKAILALEGAFGELSLGRQYTPAFLNLDNFDPFGTGLAGTSTNLFGYAGLRANNSVVYSTPSLGGFSSSLLYAFGETPGHRSANRKIGASVGYEAGPLAIGVARWCQDQGQQHRRQLRLRPGQAQRPLPAFHRQERLPRGWLGAPGQRHADGQLHPPGRPQRRRQ